MLSGAASRRVDALCVERYGLATIALMENAGRALAAETAGRLPARGHVLVLAGPGNNGGDGYAAARHLANQGAQVVIVRLGEPTTADAKANARAAEAMGVPVLRGEEGVPRAMRAAEEAGGAFHVIIDALFGTGLSRPLSGGARGLIEAAASRRAAGSVVVSADIPSGLDADSGAVVGGARGSAMAADVTVTFAALKPGLLVPGAASRVGSIVVADIGVPRALIEELGVPLEARRKEPKKPARIRRSSRG